MYIDGHEREDRTLASIESDSFDSWLLENSSQRKMHLALKRRKLFLKILKHHPLSVLQRISSFYDESTFNANDDEASQWGRPEHQVIRPKSCSSGIMVSDFITKNDGYL